MKQNNLIYTDIISQFAGKKILVLGDFILDIYLKGTSTRLSPEAPVPVVDVAERASFLGGAANTVCNLRKLGAWVTFCTVIGCDKNKEEAIWLLERIDVDTRTIIKHPERITITKTRIVADKHVVTRFDEGTEECLDELTTQQLVSILETNYTRHDAIVISDYDKGIVNSSLLKAIDRLQKHSPKFLVVDSKRLHFFSSLHPSFIKPNYVEMMQLLQMPQRFHKRAEQVKPMTGGLFEKMNAAIMAITIDTEGSVIAEKGRVVHRCFAPPVESPHVSGAGDTYLSAFLLSYICGGDAKMSGEIATAAAAIAVKKELTSHCSVEELMKYFDLDKKMITSLNQLKAICDEFHEQGKRVIFTNGCFDILHSGHVSYLHNVRKLGDLLIVGLNTDESIKRLKGKTRPINPLADRLQVLAALSDVDYIVPFGDVKDDTPVQLIKIVRPDIFAKGGDYTKEKLPEAAIVEQLGGEIVFVPHLPDHSTTEIINRINEVEVG